MQSLISPDNTWVLWAILTGSAAIAIYLEQRYAWANKVTGAILALVIVMILANLKIIPIDAPTYDVVWGFVVPLALPMLLFKANIKKIGKESGKMLIIFLIGSAGTVLGSFIAFYSLRNYVPELNKIIPLFTGSYIGGAVNFTAMAAEFGVDKVMNSAALVADNLLMALYFFVLIIIPTLQYFLKRFKHPYIDDLNKKTRDDSDKTQAGKYWNAKEISLKDIAIVVSLAFIIVALSEVLAGIFASLFTGTDFFSVLLKGLLGSKYLMITTITMMLATLFPKAIGNLAGTQEIGTFLIYIFFAVIGAPASISLIVTKAPLLLVVAAMIVFINLIISLIFGKLFKFSIEEIMIASNANVGGPTTAAAMAIAKGWDALTGPALLVGTLGYVLGNYLGILVGTIIK